MNEKRGMQALTESKQVLTGKTLVLATQNAGKVRELQDVLADAGVKVVGATEVSASLPKELTVPEGGTFEGNASLKAEAVCLQTGEWALADDSGLEVDFMEGAPGVDTAHYGGWEKLLKAMENVPEEARSARFICVLALARPGVKTLLFRQDSRGRISLTGKGEGGFGYDPVFIPEGSEKTFAKMGAEKKEFSHRQRAVNDLLTWWKANG